MNPYFQPEWIAYFISLVALAVAAYAVYLVGELRDYVVFLREKIKSLPTQDVYTSSKKGSKNGRGN